MHTHTQSYPREADKLFRTNEKHHNQEQRRWQNILYDMEQDPLLRKKKEVWH